MSNLAAARPARPLGLEVWEYDELEPLAPGNKNDTYYSAKLHLLFRYQPLAYVLPMLRIETEPYEKQTPYEVHDFLYSAIP